MTVSDDQLERQIRDRLARRLPAEAPVALRARLAAVATLETSKDAGRRRSPEPLVAIVAIAAVVLVAVFLSVRAMTGQVGVGASPTASPPTVSTLLPGQGTASPEVQPLFVVLVILAIASIGAVLRLLPPRRLPRWVAVALVTLAVVAVGARLVGGSGLHDDENWAPGLGWTDDGTPRGQFRPGPGGMFSFGITVTNGGVLPITIRGLARPQEAPTGDDRLSPAFVALGSVEPGQTWQGGIAPGPDGVRPFVPVTLRQGETTQLAVLGDGGACAIARGGASETSIGIETLPLVIDAFGLESIEYVPLSSSVEIAVGDHCP